MQKRFRTLQNIGAVLKFLAVISVILGFINLVVVPLTLSSADGIIAQLGFPGVQPGTGLITGLLLGGFLFLACGAVGMLLFATGECFNVLIAIEENTRTAASNPHPEK
jgi:hypothetical protein